MNETQGIGGSFGSDAPESASVIPTSEQPNLVTEPHPCTLNTRVVDGELECFVCGKRWGAEA